MLLDDSTPAPTCGSCGAWLARHQSARYCPGCGAVRPDVDPDLTVRQPVVAATPPPNDLPTPPPPSAGHRPGGPLPRIVVLLALLGLVLDLFLPPLGLPTGSAPVWDSSFVRVDYELWHLTASLHRTFAVEWVLTVTLLLAAFTVVTGIVTVCGRGSRAPVLFACGGAATGIGGIVTPHVYSLHGASGSAAWGALLAGLCIVMAGVGVAFQRWSLLRLVPMAWKPWLAIGCIGLLGLAGGGYPALHHDALQPARFASSSLTPQASGGDNSPDNDGSYAGDDNGDDNGSSGSAYGGSGYSDDGGDDTASTDPGDDPSDTTATTTDDGSDGSSSPCDDDSGDCSDGGGDPTTTAPASDPGPATITVAPGVDPSQSVMDTLRGYFGDINARDWQAAFETFTSDQQARISPSDIEQGAHDSTDTDITLNKLSTGNGQDVADVSFLADDEQPGGAGCQRWRLDYTMDGSDDSGWKMDLAEPLPGQPEAVAATGC